MPCAAPIPWCERLNTRRAARKKVARRGDGGSSGNLGDAEAARNRRRLRSDRLSGSVVDEVQSRLESGHVVSPGRGWSGLQPRYGVVSASHRHAPSPTCLRNRKVTPVDTFFGLKRQLGPPIATATFGDLRAAAWRTLAARRRQFRGTYRRRVTRRRPRGSRSRYPQVATSTTRSQPPG